MSNQKKKHHKKQNAAAASRSEKPSCLIEAAIIKSRRERIIQRCANELAA